MILKGYIRLISTTAFFIVLLILTTTAFGATDSITVNVTISSFGKITVMPDTMNFTGMNPGANSAKLNFSVKNTGSSNVTNMFVYTSTITDESTNPLGTGSAENLASTGFVWIQNATDAAYYHAGRLEWNLTGMLSGENLDLTAGTVNFSHGYYRNASHGDYLWKAENGTEGLCNNTGTELTIINAPENGTQHRDFSSEPLTAVAVEATGYNWSIASFSAGPLNNLCAAIYKDCTKVFIYKYDVRTTPDDFTGCSRDSNFDNTVLTAGEEIGGKAFASIPQGTSTGFAVVGTLTFSAS